MPFQQHFVLFVLFPLSPENRRMGGEPNDEKKIEKCALFGVEPSAWSNAAGQYLGPSAAAP